MPVSEQEEDKRKKEVFGLEAQYRIGTNLRDVVSETDVKGSPVCHDRAGRCGDCYSAFTDPTRRGKFGITLNNTSCHCRDICVQEVRAICARDIDFTVAIPTTTGAQSCRGEFEPYPLPFTDCQVLVTCARDELRADCTGTNVLVEFQIILTGNNVLPPTKLILNVGRTFECTRFYGFPEGNQVNVPELLRIIDGSQLVIQNLYCQILNSGGPRVRITGKLVSKLWKEDNLWVQALRPYGGITIKQEFGEPHKIGVCQIL